MTCIQWLIMLNKSNPASLQSFLLPFRTPTPIFANQGGLSIIVLIGNREAFYHTVSYTAWTGDLGYFEMYCLHKLSAAHDVCSETVLT